MKTLSNARVTRRHRTSHRARNTRASNGMPLTTFGLTELRTGTLASGAYQLRITGTTSTGRLLVKH